MLSVLCLFIAVLLGFVLFVYSILTFVQSLGVIFFYCCLYNCRREDYDSDFSYNHHFSHKKLTYESEMETLCFFILLPILCVKFCYKNSRSVLRTLSNDLLSRLKEGLTK